MTQYYSMIVARDKENGIGAYNRLPWPHCQKDMDWFVSNTKGKVIVMGYKTWVSIGAKPLPGRINIVLSREHESPDTSDFRDPTLFFKSKEQMEEWLRDANGKLMWGGNDRPIGEIVIIGGAQIYEAFGPFIRKIYLTTFHQKYHCDTFLHLHLDGCKRVLEDTQDYNMTFEIYQRPVFAVAGYDK